MTYSQYKIKDLNTGFDQICWLDKNPKVGSKITLKGIDGQFEIIKKYLENTDIDSSLVALGSNPNWYCIAKEESNIIF